ncbi:unnamed protein product [Cuscuta europaea]|uniref:GAG-pre-integrase domain-containing protein n=1 Tax=Cuscuta europaea TaxID=41803 RepID=A0A9P1E8H9_CUSEU|nr:unnamed protein product [Cuscuta europaea]
MTTEESIEEDLSYEPSSEVDSVYEFDASRYFDFCLPESSSDTERAERWFHVAGYYPPSPMGALHLRATSSGPLYPISSPSSSPLVFASVLASGPVWHRRLGHCGDSVLQFLKRNNYYVVILHLPMSVWLVD